VVRWVAGKSGVGWSRVEWSVFLFQLLYGLLCYMGLFCLLLLWLLCLFITSLEVLPQMYCAGGGERSVQVFAE